MKGILDTADLQRHLAMLNQIKQAPAYGLPQMLARKDPAPDEAYQRWQDLYQQRMQIPPDDPQQQVLGPKEHGAYAEFRVRDKPIYGLLEQMLAIPGYTAAKSAGLMEGWSKPGIDEMAEAYRGLGRGLLGNLGFK